MQIPVLNISVARKEIKFIKKNLHIQHKNECVWGGILKMYQQNLHFITKCSQLK
jgi:hypothetical protein